ncbi:hypothetical protein [Falsiroseomonas tokyonensis]|uniref:Uncharacterized protein n=1 Tax=Falsiroseomonas tokyonensis TaxID=430521 RepID=A0ABV7BZG6_9PROT|nr:hypothetical protein [Falsiroseomonas tokyonensis]MBU8539794.1 hypothetical protein [Falsiroseomonas tokyonensis]
MKIRSLALAAAIPALAALAATPASAQRAGLYDVTGTNLDGSSYTGVAQIRTVGLASFAILWRIGNQSVEGVGFASGRTVAVAYGLSQRPGIGIYTLNPDGSMEGEWTIVGAPANARERLVPREAPPAAAAAPAAPAPAAPDPAAPAVPPPAVVPPAVVPPAPAAPAPAVPPATPR